MLPDGTGFTKLHDYAYSTGVTPYGNPILINTTMYVFACDLGANASGTLLKLKTDGSSFYKMLDFNNIATGSYPRGTLVSDGNFLYGTTYRGGVSNVGTVFTYPICTQLSLAMQADTICAGQAVTVGTHTYSATGIYHDTSISTAGCVTVLTTDLQVENIDLSVTVSHDTLLANQANASYQWIDCATNTPVTGATNQQFVAGQVGNYAVIITKGCTDTTACFAASPAINGVAQATSYLQNAVTVFPNPANAELHVNCLAANAKLSVYDVLGRTVYSAVLGSANTINTSAWQQGVYTLEITAGEARAYKKVVINKQ